MPGIVKVKVIEGRNLPVMDRSADTTDAYVELKLGSITFKTDVYRKSLNPQWNTEWYKFEMADADLQDEPLQVRVMDYDTYSANDLIGKVYFNLNPLLVNSTSEIRSVLKTGLATSPGSGCISGWFPIYDTIYGLRGEINVIIKLELFSDFNKFRQSSCGIHIFCCSMIPHGYYTENIFGFVEELVVEDDPEYQWIEKIRSPRASNEARQAIFYKMSGVLQRKIGMKVVEMGGNAVIGYRQCFDLEGETGGVVVRGIGTAVKLNKHKKLDNLVRNSLYNDFKFKIPDLTVTSAFEYNRNIHSDACSIFSLTDSLHSDKCLSDFALEDRWSLCSFASRTSSNSRYTSVETLLDQTDRKPTVKSSSTLLSVARYFTSSRLSRKFSQKKKQKSILRRKFSVIEEYKQKSNGSLGTDIDNMVQESVDDEGSELVTRPKERILERIPTVEEKNTCMIFNKSLSTRSINFNMNGCSSLRNKNELNVDFDDGEKNNENQFSIEEMVSNGNCEETKNIQSSSADNTHEEIVIKELEKCIISENENKSCHSISNDNQQTSDHLTDDDVSIQTESSSKENKDVDQTNLIIEKTDNVSGKSNGDKSFRRVFVSRSISFTDKGRSSTPPISEMTPYSMSPPSNNNSSITNPVTLPINLSKAKSIGFERNFLKILRRKHVADYFSISNSPEIRRIGILNEVRKEDSLEVPHAAYTERFQTGKMEKVSADSVSVDSSTELSNNSRNISRVCVQDDDSVSAENVSPAESLDLNSSRRIDYAPDLSECSRVNDPVNNFNYLNTNETNCDVRITIADDNCNVMREALTPSRLLMHANNPDRNTSEGDKEDDSSKREGLPPLDQIVKNKSLPDTNAIVKSNYRIKETSQENESTSSSNSTDYKGYNVVHKENMELMEYPFFTLSTYPEDFIIHLGGTVSARSVKLLDRISNTEEPETRDAWWTELRVEIKSHMRTLACNAVLNYMENTSICDEVCLLSASGTAALVKIYDGVTPKMADETLKGTSVKNADNEESKSEKLTTEDAAPINCSIFHIPYRKSSLPFPVNIKTCELCKKGFVADVTFLTIEPLDRIPIIGQGAFVYAFVYRSKRDCKSELNAREISEGLPFLEYELNRQLITKLRIKGMNALFGLNVHVSVGERMIAAYATGTAMLLSALPIPPELTLVTNGKYFMQHPTSKKKLSETRKLVKDAIKKNKIEYQLGDRPAVPDVPVINAQDISDDISIQDLYPDMEYFAGSKQTCVIEVDDQEDLQVIEKLLDPYPPQGFFVSATEGIQFGSLPYVPKKNIQLIAQVYRYRISSNVLPASFNDYFHRIVQALYNKIQHRIPCSLNKISFKVNIPESDELQIRIVGMALALRESEKSLASVSTSCSSVSELADDYIINVDSEKSSEQGETFSSLTPIKQHSKKRSDVFDNEIHLTSLSYIPGATINYYLGNLNFVFIRESTLVKETGGANRFVNNFLSDVSAVVKSHAAGIGGNAVVNFFLNECLLTTHSHKNQGQCLTHVGGDVVRYVYRNP